MRNFNKQHLILTKFYVSNASSIDKQRAKLHLNLSTQTITTAAFVRSPPKREMSTFRNSLLNPEFPRLARKFGDKPFSIVPFSLF